MEDASTILSHLNPWLVFFCCIAILIIFILCLLCWFYIAFRPSRRRRSKNGHDPNPHGVNTRTTSSLDHKRVLSSRSFDGLSGHDQNMVPLECGIIRSSNYCNYPTLMQGRNSGVRENRIQVKEKRWYGASQCFSFEEIIEITSNFDRRNLIGVGSYAKVYQGLFFDGTQVAIKELTLSSVKAEELRLIMEEYPNITHKNIVKIIGFCVKELHPYASMYMFVSEYVDNGNLHQWLHNHGDIVSSLTWKIRMEIISGIAKGLAYVHEDVEVKLVHGRLQSCKILLDRQWNPKISDFGVGSLKQGHFTEEGYMAPELATTEESDVYSFGILVMEIISGRKPIDNYRRKEEIILVEWLRSKILEQDYDEIVDPKVGEAPPSKELKRMLLIALRCADFDPEYRPKMGQVIHMLQPLDLLLSNGKETVRRGRSRESQVFSENYSDYRISDNESRDDSRHSNYSEQLAITDIV